jgi:hypothetical protein
MLPNQSFATRELETIVIVIVIVEDSLNYFFLAN